MVAKKAGATKKTSSKKGQTRARAVAAGYRSGLEDETGADLSARGMPYEFEKLVLAYTLPESHHRYTPDFVLGNGIIVETKGRFLPADRKKHLAVRQAHPELDIRFVFQNARARIYKGAKTRCFEWCDKHGFLWAHKRIPDEWLQC